MSFKNNTEESILGLNIIIILSFGNHVRNICTEASQKTYALLSRISNYLD